MSRPVSPGRQADESSSSVAGQNRLLGKTSNFVELNIKRVGDPYPVEPDCSKNKDFVDNNGVMTWSPRLLAELGWPSSANVRQNVFGWSAGTADQHFHDWKWQAVNGEDSWDPDSVKKVRSPTPVPLDPTPLPVPKARAIASSSRANSYQAQREQVQGKGVRRGGKRKACGRRDTANGEVQEADANSEGRGARGLRFGLRGCYSERATCSPLSATGLHSSA